MAKFSEVASDEIVFEDAEKVKSEDLIKKDLKVLAYALRKGDKGEFAIIKAEVDGKVISFSCGGKVIMEKLSKASGNWDLQLDEKKIITFPEPVEGKFIQTKSEEGRMYFNFE